MNQQTRKMEAKKIIAYRTELKLAGYNWTYHVPIEEFKEGHSVRFADPQMCGRNRIQYLHPHERVPGEKIQIEVIWIEEGDDS